MGLDMMLYATGRISDHPAAQQLLTDMGVKAGHVDREEVAYWFKANAVHGWFVQNVQAGVDDCESYPVTIEQLEQLAIAARDSIEAVDEGKEPSLMPVDGFFFGGNEVDDLYLQDMSDTIVQLSRVTTLMRLSPDLSVSYQSSW